MCTVAINCWSSCRPGPRQPSGRSMPCYIGGGMCALSVMFWRVQASRVAQASRSCRAQPWSSSPTFLLTHLHQAGLSNLKEEGLVFLILLIINYLDWYCFAEIEKNRNWRTRGRGKRRNIEKRKGRLTRCTSSRQTAIEKRLYFEIFLQEWVSAGLKD